MLTASSAHIALSRSGKSAVTRSRNNQQNKERGNDERRDEPAHSHVTFRLAGATRICRRTRDLAFWGIGCVRSRVQRFVMIVDYPLRIVREFGEAPFKALIFAHFVRSVRRP